MISVKRFHKTSNENPFLKMKTNEEVENDPFLSLGK